MTVIKLSDIQKYKKYQLAAIVGYDVKEIDNTHKCEVISNIDCFDNIFKSIDEFLLVISAELRAKGFMISV